ncbi:hypothetical protein ACGFIF_10390 [Kribbella sp. NPDC049174]|uniref:hypothetical protein n=1 Tax=Kribbella sp. NPDC049174 TaxID=3364112 RepID=UPI00371CF23C
MTTTGDRRTWNDDQLRQAVQRCPSWRAVARALGLKGTSAGVIRTVKRHAARLELDTSHFTGQRRWSDQLLREAVPASSCWADVLAGLGVIDNGENRVRVKGHAIRLGLDCTHLKQLNGSATAEDVFSEHSGWRRCERRRRRWRWPGSPCTDVRLPCRLSLRNTTCW